MAQKDQNPTRVKKRQPSGWNPGVVRYPHSVGSQNKPFPFCVSVPFVAIAFFLDQCPKEAHKAQKDDYGERQIVDVYVPYVSLRGCKR